MSDWKRGLEKWRKADKSDLPKKRQDLPDDPTTPDYANVIITETYQSEVAKHDRISGFNNLILEFIETNNCPPWSKEIKEKLITFLKHQKEIESETDKKIEWFNQKKAKLQDIPKSGLKDRYHDMRTKYRNGVRSTSTDDEITDLD